ncbi:hypothetical protein HanRHA438_Chr01g0042551 [Helianthus annuus]|nr:hypothetical protein HanIR_Chr01g0046381 [Helianthus annuus]KAJ0949802.1 hypothetical protein HanRHA438_Chr01g0042551 [Helianthus annuus]
MPAFSIATDHQLKTIKMHVDTGFLTTLVWRNRRLFILECCHSPCLDSDGSGRIMDKLCQRHSTTVNHSQEWSI